MVNLRIEQEGETVAEYPGYDGPIPRVGEYIYHHYGQNVMSVKVVTWRMFGRGYVPLSTPTVEITV